VRRELVWAWTRGAGLEHCIVEATPQGIGLHGLVVLDWEGHALTVRYDMQCDVAWCFRRAEVSAHRGAQSRCVTVERLACGEWRVNGERAPELHGCDDINSMASPVTNTLPLRRLPLRSGSACRVDAAWVRLDGLDVLHSRQEYLCAGNAPDGTRHVRYRSIDSGFTAELSVDADGFVIDYPPYWQRRGLAA
jgi:hypothetical protein